MRKGKLKRIAMVLVTLLVAAGVLYGGAKLARNTYFGAKALALAPAPEAGSQAGLDGAYRAGVRTLGASALAELMKAEPAQNQVLSPLGMSLCYSMLLAGADGATYSELKDALAFGGLSDAEIFENCKAALGQNAAPGAGVRLELSTAIWFEKGLPLRQDYLDCCARNLYADLYEQDFRDGAGVVNNVNRWVNNKSHGKIDAILSRLSPEDVMCLVSAVYFEGKWKNPFDKERTAMQDFYPDGGGTVRCDFMHGDKTVQYKKTDAFEAVSIPYDGAYSMVLAMPPRGGTVADLLDGDTVKSILEYRAWTYGEVTDAQGVLREESGEAWLTMPKFKFTREMDMVPVLQALGVRAAFTPGADFSRAVADSTLRVGQVRQKTFLDVNEEKTVAIAINFVAAPGAAPAPREVANAVFDRPFLLAIVDSGGLPLFLGTVQNPAA